MPNSALDKQKNKKCQCIPYCYDLIFPYNLFPNLKWYWPNNKVWLNDIYFNEYLDWY